jgi:hypothetical protein
MFICKLHDSAGKLQKTMQMEKFSEYITVPTSEFTPQRLEEIEKRRNVKGNPMIRFTFSHIINKNAVNVECYYAQR